MTGDDRPDLDRLLTEALERRESERAAWLAEACGGDDALRAEIEALIAAHERAGSAAFLAEPLVQGAAEGATLAAPLTEGPGATIDRYKLLQHIGEGGFGVVYMAEQETPVRRRVALKIIKLGMDTKQVIARFEAERQALALMDHPNIAKVLDAGATDTGRPYFVMELVKGEPMTDYCDRNNVSTQERLALFIDVCKAVEHAHQKGVIHRDLKPSNVMVTLHDGAPVPKVIDFGIAKATNQRLTEKTLFTEYRQFIGTPEYMSPEQAEMSGLDVDTRSDVYSLGVLLYELLTGTTPFDPARLREAGYVEIQRIIREEEPQKPSTRLSSLSSRERVTGASGRVRDPRPGTGSEPKPSPSSLNDIAHHRHTDPASLTRTIRGDLDWIVMKCLEKDRTRRYETANGLASDIRRYLNDEPVAASPPTATYRLKKLIRRNKGPVAAMAALFLALLLGAAGTSIGMIRAFSEATRADREADEAKRQAAISDAVTRFLNDDLLAAVRPEELGREVTMRDVLDEASRRLEGQFDDEPLVEARLHRTIGVTYEHLGLYDVAIRHMRSAVTTYERELGDEDPRTLNAMNFLAVVFGAQGRYDEGESLHRETLEAQRRVLGPEHPDTLTSMNNLANVYIDQGRYAEAESLCLQVMEIKKRLLGPEHESTLATMNNLANAYKLQHRYEQAEPLYIGTLETQRRVLGPEHPHTLASMSNLANVYIDQGRYDEAERLHAETLEMRRRVLGPDHPKTAGSLLCLASLYQLQGRYDEAETLYLNALEVKRRTLDPEHPATLKTLNSLASLHHLQGRAAEAEEGYRETLQAQRRILGPEHPDTLLTTSNLAIFYWTRERYDEAEPLYLEVLEAERRTFGPEHRVTLQSMCDVGYVYELQERYEEATSLYEDAVEAHRRVYGRDDEGILRPMNGLAWVLLQAESTLRDPDRALDLARRELCERSNHENPWHLDTLALALFETGDVAGAVETARRALEVLPQDAKDRAEYEEVLARYEAALIANDAPPDDGGDGEHE